METAAAAGPDVEGAIARSGSAGLVPAAQFLLELKSAAGRHRHTRATFGVVRALMLSTSPAQIDERDRLLRDALAAEAGGVGAISELGDGTFAALLEPCCDEDVLAFVERVEARVAELASARKVPDAHVLSGAMVSGARVVTAGRVLNGAMRALAESVDQALEMGASVGGPVFWHSG